MRRFVEEADRGQWTLLPECLDGFIDESILHQRALGGRRARRSPWQRSLLSHLDGHRGSREVGYWHQPDQRGWSDDVRSSR